MKNLVINISVLKKNMGKVTLPRECIFEENMLEGYNGEFPKLTAKNGLIKCENPTHPLARFINWYILYR